MGKLTEKPTTKPLAHLCQKLELNPAFINVKTKDMKKDMAKDTEVPNKML
jgi:hypothetical protein